MNQALSTANQTDLRESYCKLLIWWKSPDEIDDQELIREIMNLSTWELWKWHGRILRKNPLSIV